MNRSKFHSLFFLVLSAGIFAACTKSEDIEMATSDNDFETVLATINAETESDQAVTLAEYAIDNLSSTSQSVKGLQKAASTVAGPNVYRISKIGQYPIKYIVDFGAGKMISTSKYLKGQITVTTNISPELSKRYDFTSLSVNDIPVHGYKLVTKPATGILNIAISDTTKTESGTTVIRNSERLRTCVDNNNTANIYTDDTYSYQGASSGVNKYNVAYKMQITKPLIAVSGYKYYTSGTAVTTTSNGVRTIDYGNGDLDSLATVTTNGVSKQVVLHW